MTKANNSRQWVAIGAFELKQTYQRNMMIGLLVVLLFCAALLTTATLLDLLWGESLGAVHPTQKHWGTIIDPPPPRPIRDSDVEVKIHGKPPELNLALPKAVDDADIGYDYTYSSRDELDQLHRFHDQAGSGTGGSVGRIGDTALELLPEPEEFVPYQEAPVALKLKQAEYPVMARKAGIEGEVWVKVLVDTQGNVHNAIIYISSGSNAGFEEAALQAALQGKWRPAMQNKKPVATWVAYKIEFRLR